MCQVAKALGRVGETIVDSPGNQQQPEQRECASDVLNVDETAMLSPEAESVLVRLDRRRMPGDTFGRYRIQKTLGEGAMGSVYLAHDTQLDRKVALKIPKVDAKQDSKFIDRFLREARAAANLTHPNICPVYDVGEIDGTHFITMAYIQGHTLSHFINAEKPQTDRNVANVVRKVAHALHEAHIHGMVHRDVKPGNIMIDQRGEPIVMDFGLARSVDDEEDARLTRDGMILGSPAYMSPEQVEGRQEKIGPTCDIYSLGVILYELLTGRLPYQGSVTSIIAQIVSKPPPHPATVRPDISPGLAEICLRAMARQIADRYQSMREFAAALTDYLKSKPEVADRAVLFEPISESRSAVPRATTPGTTTVPSDKIEFLCGCGQRLTAAKRLSGSNVRCPRCAAVLTIPGPKPVQVTCQGCQQQFMARADLAGKVVKCTACGRPIQVPAVGQKQPVAPQIEVACACGQHFLAASHLAGKRVRCTACGQVLRVPTR
jgi:serine/threonine protein kinase